MPTISAAEQALRDRDPQGALKLLQDEIRGKAGDPKLRVFLFQLLSVLGQWDRALNQLEVAASLDPAALAMAQTYREAVRCEVLRAQVFEGVKAPMVFGEPEQWLAYLIESLLLDGRRQAKESDAMRARAFDEAPASAGTIDGRAFEWIADADVRLGPVLEAVINGRYYWVPFARLLRVSIEAPEDLRDVVWTPAHLMLENGGEAYALVPTRYPGTEKQEDGDLLLARKTTWQEPRPEFFCGLGQRVLSTDGGEVSLMD
ncbi:MAG: virulence protein SciE type, partial [Betaproteobacteria bacterium]|nr:virulence protein SciE type [Betaproteobacteria bacterium]